MWHSELWVPYHTNANEDLRIILFMPSNDEYSFIVSTTSTGIVKGSY